MSSHMNIQTTSMEERNDAWQHMTRTVAHYERLEQIGEGTYGQVYRARCRDSGLIVAMKKMRIHHGGYWGMPLQLIREIKILKRLRHPNLLRMIEVVTSKGVEHLDGNDPPAKNHQVKDKVADARESFKGNLFLVLEYVDHDLTGLLDVAYQFTPVQIKCIFKQLLEALAFMHQNKYVHRDIKSSNLLMDSHFHLKLADFGLARSIEAPLLDQVQDRNSSSAPEFTNKVITLWYRPPEILLGGVHYGPAVDVWSAGCILAELILGKPLFAGKTELDQLNLILEMLGAPPSEETYDYFESGMKKGKTTEVLSLSRTYKPPGKLRTKYASKIPSPALGLLEKLLTWDPRQRISAAYALEHRYFWTEPAAPATAAALGETIQVGGPQGHFHEFQTKRKRKQAKAVAEEAKEELRRKGGTPEAVQAEYDRVYKGMMKKVVEEGLGANEATQTEPKAVEDRPPKESIDDDSRREERRSSSSKRRREERKSRGRSPDDEWGPLDEDSRRHKSSRESRSHRESASGRKRHKEDRGEERGSRSSGERRHRGGDRDRRKGDDMETEGRTERLPVEEADNGSARNGDRDRHTARDPVMPRDEQDRQMLKEGPPDSRDRFQGMDRDPHFRQDRGPRDLDRPRERGPMDAYGPARDNRAPFDDFGRPRDRNPVGDLDRPRDRHPPNRPRDRPPYDDRDMPRDQQVAYDDRGGPRGRPPNEGRDRPRDGPPFENDRTWRRERPPQGDPRDWSQEQGPDRRRGEMQPPDDRGRPFNRPRDMPPLDDRERLRDRPFGEEGRRPARGGGEDMGRYGPVRAPPDEQRFGRDQAGGRSPDRPPQSPPRPDETDRRRTEPDGHDRDRRRSGDRSRRRKDKKRHRERSRSRERHEPRRPPREDRGENANASSYGPRHRPEDGHGRGKGRGDDRRDRDRREQDRH